jgi:hypothetical protein
MILLKYPLIKVGRQQSENPNTALGLVYRMQERVEQPLINFTQK